MNLKMAQEFFNFFMKPMTIRHEVQHIKISGAITNSIAGRFVTQLSYIKPERPNAFMISINSAVGSIAAAQLIHNAIKEASNNFNAPVYTFAEDFALGPAYYLLSLGNRVHASNNNHQFDYQIHFHWSGVMRKFNTNKTDFAIHQKQISWNRVLKNLKIQPQLIGQESLLLDAYSELTEKQTQFVKKQINFELKTLIEQVKLNRKDQLQAFSEDKINNEILVAKPFNSEEAVKNGLIDEILTFEEFQSQNYEESKVQEISMRKGIKEKFLIQSSNELSQQFERILQKFDKKNNKLESQIKKEIQQLMIQYLKDPLQTEKLNDLMMEILNTIIVNSTCNDSKILMI